MRKNTSGFTIVELIIVIVVIGILAAITVVAYNGIQSRARDAARNQNIANITRIVGIYLSNGGDFSGCGTGSGSGWLNYTYGTNKTIMQCLIDAGVTNSPIKDPDPAKSTSGIGLYNCSGTFWVATQLETSNDQSAITSGPFSSCSWKQDALNANYKYVRQIN